jgi:hypothetical protein
MKIRYAIGIVVTTIITVYFVAAGLAGSQSQVVEQNHIIEKAISSDAIQNALGSEDQFEPDKSIFPKTNFLSLIFAIIGIVAFRRNTYS